MRIYNVISIVYLKSIIDLAEDSYRRRRLFIIIIIMNSEDEYEVEKIL